MNAVESSIRAVAPIGGPSANRLVVRYQTPRLETHLVVVGIQLGKRFARQFAVFLSFRLFNESVWFIMVSKRVTVFGWKTEVEKIAISFG